MQDDDRHIEDLIVNVLFKFFRTANDQSQLAIEEPFSIFIIPRKHTAIRLLYEMIG
jgi:hypothetical protein